MAVFIAQKMATSEVGLTRGVVEIDGIWQCEKGIKEGILSPRYTE